MKLIQMSGFEDSENYKARLFGVLEALQGQHVLFKGGRSEPGPFHSGQIMDFSGDTVTFWNGIADMERSIKWTYPYWEVMLAIEEIPKK